MPNWDSNPIWHSGFLFLNGDGYLYYENVIFFTCTFKYVKSSIFTIKYFIYKKVIVKSSKMTLQIIKWQLNKNDKV